MPASSFDFLADSDVHLHDLATSAEALLYADPVACLTRLRAFAEHCTQTYIRRSDLPSHWNDLSQYERLEQIENAKAASRTTLDPLHRIRRAGNAAVHDNEGTLRKAKRQLRHAHTVAVWVHVNVYERQKPQGSFRIPEPPSSSERPARTESNRTSPPEPAPPAPSPHPDTATTSASRNEASPAEDEYFPEPEPPGPGAGTRTWNALKQAGTQASTTVRDATRRAGAGIQSGVRRTGRAVRRSVAYTGQRIRDALAWIVNTIRAVVAAIWRSVCAVGRFVKRLVKRTVLVGAIGALVVYFPAVYATTTGWLPETTQQNMPAPDAVTEQHARWIPPSVQQQVGAYALYGWQTARSGAHAAWDAAVHRGEQLIDRMQNDAEPDAG